MPSRRIPNTTPAVLRTLKAAHDTYLNTPVAADRAIGADLFAKLDLTLGTPSLYETFLKETSDVDIALATQAPLSTAVAQDAARLTMLVSHFHQVLDLAITRGYFPVGTRSYYGRDITATALPDLSSYEAVALAASKITEGEAARAAATGSSYLAMALPSADEVTLQLGDFNNSHAASQQSLVKTNNEREDVSTLYPTAQALAVDICDTVEFYYRHDPDASSRREKCAQWGVVYFFEPNETPDPVVPTPPTP